MDDSPMNDSPMPYEFDALLHLGSTSALLHGITSINLTPEDNLRLCAPWKYSLIIKLMSHRINHKTLRNKLEQLWKFMDQLPLIDLGSNYYILKFANIDK